MRDRLFSPVIKRSPHSRAFPALLFFSALAFFASCDGIFDFNSPPVTLPGDGDEETDLSADEGGSDDIKGDEPDDVRTDRHCSNDEDCEDDDPCTAQLCDTDAGLCLFPVRDRDDDGYADEECGGEDCDDMNWYIHPGAVEICDDDTDNDCDDRTDCEDTQCFGTEDCPCMEETEATCHDGLDNDCDGVKDCEDDDCVDICACVTDTEPCDEGLTCCSTGCCDTQSDIACCGGCGLACGGRDPVCDRGTCEECNQNWECDDDNPCTNDVCTEDSKCVNEPRPDGEACGSGNVCCDGECVECCWDTDCDDDNPCTLDACMEYSCASSTVADMTACPGGVCCGGVCRSGGECCTSDDCPGWCAGTARRCATVSPEQCETQDGCELYSGCGGGQPPCGSYGNESECFNCGCFWIGSPGSCMGFHDACESFEDEEICEDCGCGWGGGCNGTHAPCPSYSTSEECAGQLDCSWAARCSEYRCLD